MVMGAVAHASGNVNALPDGRQWEMVSPPNKNGAIISAMEREGGVAQAAADGGAFTWAASTPIGAEPAGNRAPEWSQVLSTRDTGGWSSQDVAGPNAAVTGLATSDLSEYKFFSSDLALGLVEPKGETPLSPQATEKTIYLRDLSVGAPVAGAYLPLVANTNVLPGSKFGQPRFLGATPDLSHVVFSSTEALTSNARTGGNLYEWAGGQLRLVSVLPEREGDTVASEAYLGSNDMARHAISSDGSRIIWTKQSGSGGGALYMRDMTKGETVRLDVAQGAREPAQAAAQFQTASDDGSRVFFTDPQQLTEDFTATPTEHLPDLYVFETTNDESESPKGTLTDLTVGGNPGESADVQGLLPGASEDGSYVYFVADGVLGDGAAAGALPGNCAATGAPAEHMCNLYVAHYDGTSWTTTFIARLSGDDEPDWARGEGSIAPLAHLTARVSPDGRYLAFMSDRELTGYDNHDANSGAADEEVFLYDAVTKRLVCVSCNPSGAPPIGVQDEGKTVNAHQTLIDNPEVWNHGRWLAGNIPGWTPANSSFAFYQSRYLSDSGRLFFNSSNALVPQDENGTEDVYEYELVGVGSCESGISSGSQVYKPARSFAVEGREGEEPAGCVGLISSGSSAEESVFLDASESGGDVFFLTAARLVPQDYDTSLDVYDAHECTPQSPCVAPPAVALPECTTADGCRALATPQPPIFGLPASATFSGAGNSAPASSVKPLTRAQELTKALKACRKKPKKKKQKQQQRAACEKRARDEYRPPAKAQKTSRGRK